MPPFLRHGHIFKFTLPAIVKALDRTCIYYDSTISLTETIIFVEHMLYCCKSSTVREDRRVFRVLSADYRGCTFGPAHLLLLQPALIYIARTTLFAQHITWSYDARACCETRTKTTGSRTGSTLSCVANGWTFYWGVSPSAACSINNLDQP